MKFFFKGCLFLVIGVFFVINFTYIPQKERCDVSEIIKSDDKNHSLKFVNCRKGLDKFFEINWVRDGLEFIESTSAYIVVDVNNNIIKILEEEKNNNIAQGQISEIGRAPESVFIGLDDDRFITKNSKLMSFKDGDIKFISNIPDYQYFYYENKYLYYIEDNTNIMKYDIVSGESIKIISVEDIKRDELYKGVYDVSVTKIENNLSITFSLVTNHISGKSQTKDYYLLNLYSEKLIKLSRNPYTKGQFSNVPQKIKYSQVFASAKDYGLSYDNNNFINTYYFIQSIFKY